MRIQISSRFGCQSVVDGINAHLPKGIRILDCRLRSESRKAGPAKVHRFHIDLGGVTFDQEALRRFSASRHWPYLRTRPKRPDQAMDLKTSIKTVKLHDGHQIELEIDAQCGVTVRPSDFLCGVLGLATEDLPKVGVTKRLARPEKSKVDNTTPSR